MDKERNIVIFLDGVKVEEIVKVNSTNVLRGIIEQKVDVWRTKNIKLRGRGALRRELTVQRPDPEDRKKPSVKPKIGPVLLLDAFVCRSLCCSWMRLSAGACAAPG